MIRVALTIDLHNFRPFGGPSTRLSIDPFLSLASRQATRSNDMGTRRIAHGPIDQSQSVRLMYQ